MSDSSLESPPSTTQASSRKEKWNGSSDPLTLKPAGRRQAVVRKVHVVLAPKGGCGKTFIASLNAQALIERGEPVLCLDTDRENASLPDIPALKAKPVALFQPDSDEIDIHAMDTMTEELLTEDTHVVMDNGATSFAPFGRYLVDGNVPAVVTEAGKRMVVHAVIAGGQELEQTVRGFASVAAQFPEHADLVLWVNEHHGSVDMGGIGFEQTPVYDAFRHRITAIVRLPRLNPSTSGANLADMLARKMTFAEADASPDFFIIAKQRLRQIKRPIFEQLAVVL